MIAVAAFAEANAISIASIIIKPDTVNPLDGISSVLAAAYLEAYAIAFVNLPKGLLVI